MSTGTISKKINANRIVVLVLENGDPPRLAPGGELRWRGQLQGQVPTHLQDPGPLHRSAAASQVQN